MTGVTVSGLPVVDGVRPCVLCWRPIGQANGFVLARDALRLVERREPERRRLPRELCGLCGVLFMTELRALLDEPVLPEYA